VLEALGVDFIDESEVLTPADESHHIWKHDFKVPFVCGCRDLGEALRRIAEGAAMIRTKGEAGTGNIVEAVRHMRAVQDGIRRVHALPEDELVAEAKALGAPLELVIEVHKTGKLPVVNFAAGGVATPADAALMMQLGAEGVLLLGCPPDECHYEFGNKRAQEFFAETAALAHLLGIAPERLRLDWVEAGDSQSFVDKVSRFAEGVFREIKESGNQQIGQSAGTGQAAGSG
jgi:coenzyme F420-reducing hydrogenase delta subunit